LLILEPYFRFAFDDPSKGIPHLRCDNPQSVVIFDNEGDWRDMQAKCCSETQTPSEPFEVDANLAEEFRQQGNIYFHKKEWKKAVALYSKGLLYHPCNALLLSNRAASYLKLHAWNSALDDASAALHHEPENIKAAYRLCVSLLYLQRPQEAMVRANQLLATVTAKGDPAKELHTLVSDLEVAIKEQRGNYNFPRISVEMKSWSFEDPHRHMDFSHPFLTRKDVSGKGTGMFATEDLPTSSLIMVSRAFALAEAPLEELRMNITGDSRGVKTGSLAVLLPKVKRLSLGDLDKV
jgi:tetratricopeptide (TPR) repeat protein